MTEDAFTPTPASAWVDPNPPREVELPSGNKAVVKKPNLYILGRTGQVPQKVAKAAARTKKTDGITSGSLDVRAIAARIDDIELYVDWALTRAFISPRVTLDAEEGAVPVAALTADDKAFVLEVLEIEV
jgi:hypothetical protein